MNTATVSSSQHTAATIPRRRGLRLVPPILLACIIAYRVGVLVSTFNQDVGVVYSLAISLAIAAVLATMLPLRCDDTSEAA